MTLDGRIRGAYVYVLLCRDAEDTPVYVKIGLSASPLSRLATLRGACPIAPREFAYVPVFNRPTAQAIEQSALQAFRPWRTQGEWIRIPPGGKSRFNALWKDVLEEFRTPGWAFTWTRIDPVAYFRMLDQRRQAFRSQFATRRHKNTCKRKKS